MRGLAPTALTSERRKRRSIPAPTARSARGENTLASTDAEKVAWWKLSRCRSERCKDNRSARTVSAGRRDSVTSGGENQRACPNARVNTAREELESRCWRHAPATL